MIQRTKSEALFNKAKTLFPGGVNSPVRAFKSVGGTPLFIERGEGAYLYDADGNKYIDFCNSWGPLILGHANEKVTTPVIEATLKGSTFGAPTAVENKLADLIISNNKYIEKIRFVSSGTEAAMSAIRLARGYTGKNKIIKFDGCYHGHVDSLLVNAGSGLVTLGESSSAGIPASYTKETIVLPLNNQEAVLKAIEEYGDDIACIALEPIPANNGLLIQGPEFLKFLRDTCDKTGILLFFDEVISGFRVGFEGAAGYYGIQPDMVAYGKIIGGGFPVGAYGASAKVMGSVSPDGPVYQAGTLSGNPVAMTAGYATLTQCLEPGFYETLNQKTDQLVTKVMAHAKEKGYQYTMYHIGSIFWMAFSEKPHLKTAKEIDPKSMAKFSILHLELLNQGVYIGPSGYEVGFISAAHSMENIEYAATAFIKALDKAFA
ncbi:MAG: glutamate-1-semialdehyde 2,1-aminomutase [Luteibaculaceae bacterium]